MFASRSRAAFLAGLTALLVTIACMGTASAQELYKPSFGVPPSGEVPILYNDHFVYAKPDELKRGRVLVALVHGDALLVPLRAMFEQMHATVSYDPSSRTTDASAPGVDVKVTVGQAEIIINGQSRPLDVPPEIYRGNMVVPLRVISEALGAYVQWLPDRHVAIVRQVEWTSAPSPAPIASAAPSPTPTPAPMPTTVPYKDVFIAGDYIFSPKVYNEFSPGNSGKSGSYAVRGAWEFDAAGLPWMIAGDFRQYEYPHNNDITLGPLLDDAFGSIPCFAPGDEGCVTTIGGAGQTYVLPFTARNQNLDVRLALKVLEPRIYIGLGFLSATNNYGYPRLSGAGFGAEKLPDLDRTFSVYGSLWYYPNAKGTFIDPSGNNFNLAYNVLKYHVGGAVLFGKSPLFLDLGFLGQREGAKSNAPASATYNGPFAGLGLKL